MKLAKFARGLIERIIDHIFQEGWVSKGQTVVDPFGGVSTGGIICAFRGLRWIGCELEKKFVQLSEENFDLHKRTWDNLQLPFPRIIQGDSRKLSQLLTEAGIVISSPPYADEAIAKNSKGIDRKKQWETYRKSGGGLSYERFCEQQDRHSLEYGITEGQLQTMKTGEIEAVISSPPYEESEGTPSIGRAEKVGGWMTGGSITARAGMDAEYGKSEGQLGHTISNTFWEAARNIVCECYKVLKPGGYAIWVCKEFVRKKKIVPFSNQWQQLCESCGFETVCRHKAMLVENWKENTLFGEVRKEKAKVSFFRRLAEKKGSPRITHEDVLCTRKK